jgi:cytochrome b561
VHYIFSRMLMVLVTIHVAGAVYHTLLRRMGFGRRAAASGKAP